MGQPVGPCTVHVEVLDGDGAPADGAAVMITTSSGNHNDIAAITDAWGTVELDQLEPGPLVVEAHAEDGRATSGIVELTPEASVTVVLRFPAR